MAALTFTRYSSTGYGTSWQTYTQVRLHTMLSLKESEVPVTLPATEANAKTPIWGKKTNTRRGDRKQASSQTGARRSDVNGLLTVESWSIDSYIQGSTDGQSSRMRRAKSSTQTVRNGTERWSGALITSMICWQWRQSTWAPRTDPCRHVRWSLSRSRAYMQRGRQGDTDRHTETHTEGGDRERGAVRMTCVKMTSWPSSSTDTINQSQSIVANAPSEQQLLTVNGFNSPLAPQPLLPLPQLATANIYNE